jgi:hypothetical protein
LTIDSNLRGVRFSLLCISILSHSPNSSFGYILKILSAGFNSLRFK